MTSSPPEIDRHPRKAFFALFFIEIWERFGYYGIASLMVLYMVEHLGLGDARADIIWGAFSALAYSMPMLGGYIGDRVNRLNQKDSSGATGVWAAIDISPCRLPCLQRAYHRLRPACRF